MNIYEHIDYTLLKADTTYKDIYNLCKTAEEKGCASVCIPSHFVSFAKSFFPNVSICTVVGFPLGNSTTETKLSEVDKAIEDGASEIDMVINIGDIKHGNYAHALDEINVIKKMMAPSDVLKVIIETCYLTDEEIAIATQIVDKSKADYVKTSTGFGTRGASFKDIKIMKKNIHNRTKIKASGGIRTEEEMEKYIEIGCDRIGASKLP